MDCQLSVLAFLNSGDRTMTKLEQAPSDVDEESCLSSCSAHLACNCGATDIHAIYPPNMGKTRWPPRPLFWECQVCFTRYKPDYFDNAFSILST